MSLEVCEAYVGSHSSSKLWNLNVNTSLESTVSAVDYIFEKRVFTASLLTDAPYAEALKLVYVNIAAQHNMQFIDTELFVRNCMTPQEACEAIRERLGKAQDVILWGYPRARGETFPRASDEIHAVEKNIGPVRMMSIIGDNEMEFEITDPKWELVRPEEPPKVENPDEEKPAEEEEGKVPQLNIYEFEWTRSDGHAKNIAQIFNQVKQPQRVGGEASLCVGEHRGVGVQRQGHLRQLRGVPGEHQREQDQQLHAERETGGVR